MNHTLYGLPLFHCRLFSPYGPLFILWCIIDHPQNYINYDIRGFFPDNRVHTQVWPLYSRTSGCVHSLNPFGAFLDLDPTHATPGLPYALRSLRFDPSLSLVKLYKEPLGTLNGGEIRENWEYRNYSPLLPELMLESASLCPLEHCCVLPKLAFASELAIGVMEDWGGGGPSGGFSFSGSQTCRQRLSLVISDSY